jgi:DNA-binding GntR family transcriptional regulator
LKALNHRTFGAMSGTDHPDPTLRTRAQSLLRNAILDGHFVAGQKLVERELCDLTGASRSSLREALVNLETNGLIEHQSYRGYSVSRLNVQKVREIFELRASVETLAAELFTERASVQEVVALGEALSALEQCQESFDLAQMRAVKERYYEVLFTGCRNGEIRRALGNVIDRIHLLRIQLMQDPARRIASLAEMRSLTSALVKRDRLAARAASQAHIRAARDAVLNSMAQDDVDPRAATTESGESPEYRI